MGSDLKYQDAAELHRRLEYARKMEARPPRPSDGNTNTWSLRCRAIRDELAMRRAAGTPDDGPRCRVGPCGGAKEIVYAGRAGTGMTDGVAVATLFSAERTTET